MSSEFDEIKPSLVTNVEHERHHDTSQHVGSDSEKSAGRADTPTLDSTDPTLPLNWSTKKKIFNGNSVNIKFRGVGLPVELSDVKLMHM
jgi:hypothetical protein